MARPPTSTTLVGENISASPWPMIQAVMVVARLTPAKSASGASSGMASAPWPELDGISMPSGMFTTTVSSVNTPAEAPLTSCSIECRMVPSVCVLFMMADTPPASSTTIAGPIMSAAPAAIRRTVSFSPMRATKPTSTEARMNSMASCGNHQFSSNQKGATPATSCVP